MNAEAIITGAVEAVIARHFLLFSRRKCTCEQWKAERRAGYSQLQKDFNHHIAAEITTHLLTDLPKSAPDEQLKEAA